MALLDVNFFSEALGLSTAMKVILPQATSTGQVGMQGRAPDGRCPVLYLLHGWSDDETIWTRRTSIERYASEAGLAVVMPRGGLSYYQNTAGGMAYWTLVSEEIPALCERWFPITTAREGTFAAGLSMGGYGALRLGLSRPEKFRAVASLSGVTDLRTRWTASRTTRDADAKLMATIFGADGPGPASDLFSLAEAVAASGRSPSIHLSCGTEDFLYADNVRFRDHARALGLDLEYAECRGSHEWGFWDQGIRCVLDWLCAFIPQGEAAGAP